MTLLIVALRASASFIVSEGEVDSDDGLVGEKLHQLSMKRASERAERKKAKKSEPRPSWRNYWNVRSKA